MKCLNLKFILKDSRRIEFKKCNLEIMRDSIEIESEENKRKYVIFKSEIVYYSYFGLDAEKKKAQWLEDVNGAFTENNDVWECSECHEAFYLEDGTTKENKYNYCPNCGAMMKDADQEE